jgi:hypothetical protein
MLGFAISHFSLFGNLQVLLDLHSIIRQLFCAWHLPVNTARLTCKCCFGLLLLHASWYVVAIFWCCEASQRHDVTFTCLRIHYLVQILDDPCQFASRYCSCCFHCFCKGSWTVRLSLQLTVGGGILGVIANFRHATAHALPKCGKPFVFVTWCCACGTGVLWIGTNTMSVAVEYEYSAPSGRQT